MFDSVYHVYLRWSGIPLLSLSLVLLWWSYRYRVPLAGAVIMVFFGIVGSSTILPDMAPYALPAAVVWPTGMLIGLHIFIRSMRGAMRNGPLTPRAKQQAPELSWKRP